MWPYDPKTLLLFTIGYLPVGAKETFSLADLRILTERFRKCLYINLTEAEFLAEMLHVQPVQVLVWFQHERSKGSLQTAEIETKVITLIRLIFGFASTIPYTEQVQYMICSFIHKLLLKSQASGTLRIDKI